MTPIRIGTRGSKLALWQANHVADRLRPLAAPGPVELVIIATAGDQVRDVPLAQIGGEGVFTKEIQRALLDGSVDVAVHSLKDLPTIPVEGLVLAAVPERGPAGDVFVSERHRRFDDLPRGAVLATSSLRRRAQVLHRRPDLKVTDIRGNVETRLRKLHESGLDATILAEAGLLRLGLQAAITEVLDPAWMLPAVGQGALGLECRAADRETLAVLEPLNHLPTRRAVLAERAMLSALGGGCQVPMGVVSRVDGGVLTLRGAVVRPDGSERIEAEGSGPAEQPEGVGRRIAEELLARGSRGHYLFSNVRDAQERRYQGLFHPLWTPSMVFLINYFCDQYFRWFDAGDLQGESHLRNIVRVARETPQVRHWLPTREAAVVRSVRDFPENLVVRVSAALIDGGPPRGFRNTSTVVTDPGTATCPAPQQEGVCGDCRKCWEADVANVAYRLH